MANPPPKIRWAIFIALALLALAVRLPHLGERPMHTDESVNAYLTGELLAGKSFRYDPQDRHGPALSLLAEPVARLCGAKSFSELKEAELRLSAVFAGTATVLLLGAGVEIFGFIPCLVAALLFAFAPLPVYYSRYFIHETLFVAATLGLLLSGWRAARTNSPGPAALAGCCAALLLACKETAVIPFFALGAAAACAWFLKTPKPELRSWGAHPPRVWMDAPRVQPFARGTDAGIREISLRPMFSARARKTAREARALPINSGIRAKIFPSRKTLTVACAVFIAVAVLLFTWFGRNWAALADLLRAIPNFAARAGGQGHEKPFWYYLKLLSSGCSGGAILALALWGFFRTRASAARVFLAVYALLTAAIYSAIPYKTPWLALNLWLPLAILAGVAVERLWLATTKPSVRSAILAGAAVLGLLIARDTRERVFKNPADEDNPYAYAHTVVDLLRLPPRVQQLAEQRDLASPRIAVVAADPWPLPWYLRKYPRVGYWQPDQDPGAADFYLTSPEAAEKLGERLKMDRPEFFGVRPEAVIILWPAAATNAAAPPSPPGRP